MDSKEGRQTAIHHHIQSSDALLAQLVLGLRDMPKQDVHRRRIVQGALAHDDRSGLLDRKVGAVEQFAQRADLE